MEAYDSVYPDQIASTVVLITVTRNRNGPEFKSSSYKKTIAEDFEVGGEVLVVEAEDDDEFVSTDDIL